MRPYALAIASTLYSSRCHNKQAATVPITIQDRPGNALEDRDFAVPQLLLATDTDVHARGRNIPRTCNIGPIGTDSDNKIRSLPERARQRRRTATGVRHPLGHGVPFWLAYNQQTVITGGWVDSGFAE